MKKEKKSEIHKNRINDCRKKKGMKIFALKYNYKLMGQQGTSFHTEIKKKEHFMSFAMQILAR